ncbi:hypothetical protein [Fibrella aquatica]|jgi:hypothetical protein|uniref:hypothetical protein n=1 Tax=Fibrella aquatica TaxID=3242487 RepID=UPI003521C894
MKRILMYVTILTAIISWSCQSESNNLPTPAKGVLLNDSFSVGTNGWEGGYTDYSTPQDSLINFKFEQASLPMPLNAAQKSLRVYGENRSDDLFMYVSRKLTNLSPNKEYTLLFEIELASLYPESGFGIGGGPATSVMLKAGASPIKPEKIKDGDYYRLNIDKGNQLEGGKDMVAIGNLANGKDIEEYTLIQRSNDENPFKVRANDRGELWLIIGTDSGFEGNQSIYYNRIKVTAL